MIFVVVLASFLLTAVMTWRFSQPQSLFYILDNPNERSLHTSPTPRGGGMAIISAILVACGILFANYFNFTQAFFQVGIACVLLALTAFLDDKYQLPVIARFSVHILAAALLIYSGLVITDFGLLWYDLDWIAPVLLVLFVIWMINLYNFMDGMDGFAAGMAVIGFGTLSIIGILANQHLYANINSIIAAAALGFLMFNFPPAKIFMGDIGSSVLGFLLAFSALWGIKLALFQIWIPLLIFSPYIVDATVTLISRLIRLEKVWKAHKSHYYQRLVERGWGHRKTVLLEYLLMLLCSVSALFAVGMAAPGLWVVLVVWGLLYLIMFVVIEITASRDRCS